MISIAGPMLCYSQVLQAYNAKVIDHKQQMAEWLGNRAINQKVAGSFPSRANWRCVLGQGTSPYLPRRMSLYLL